jgi:hypothetical protein
MFDRFAFGFCSSLRSLFIPASLRHMASSSIRGCEIESATVDEANRFFRFCDDFLIDFGKMSLIRYRGHEKDVQEKNQRKDGGSPGLIHPIVPYWSSRGSRKFGRMMGRQQEKVLCKEPGEFPTAGCETERKGNHP